MTGTKIFIYSAILLLICHTVHAQPGGGGDPGGGQPVPIGGMEFLLGLGAALGVKKILGLRNKNKSL